MKVIVYKTNIKNEYQKEMIAPVIGKIKGITEWSIDFEDKDKVLRIEGYSLNPKHIEAVIIKAGFECEILY
ncbi:MAG: hypothetical protein QY303_10455 [Vicingaceae bacterium]|nr:MAG: hypothetical protein QY303_10455 [Vicingaceae bacterium]